jgi:hypothetical protein
MLVLILGVLLCPILAFPPQLLSSATLVLDPASNTVLSSKVDLSTGSVIIYTPVLGSSQTLLGLYRLNASASTAMLMVSKTTGFPATSTNPIVIPLGISYTGVSYDTSSGASSIVLQASDLSQWRNDAVTKRVGGLYLPNCDLVV